MTPKEERHWVFNKTATSYVFCCLNMLLTLGTLNINTAGGKQTKVAFLNYTKNLSAVNVCARKEYQFQKCALHLLS